MKREKKGREANPRIDPRERLCPKFDETSIAAFPVASPEEMGLRVLDDCAEEHIM